MLERWRHLRRNAGTFAVVRTAVVLVVVFVAAVVMAFVPGLRIVTVVAAAGLIGPYLGRDWLVEHAEAVVPVHRYGGIGLIIAALVLREPLQERVGPLVTVALYGLLALYMSSYFWLLSDPRIEIRGRR